MADLTEPRYFGTGVVAGKALLPDRPTLWSYSSLKEVETCPRRYALSRADYPELWEQRGYPRVPIPAAIKGDVVHGALEIIVNALVRAGCSSTRSAEAVAVLRELGGYTEVAEGVLEVQLAGLNGNPRVSSDRREQLTRALTDWLPEAREHIQTYFNRMELRPGASPAPAAAPTPPTKQGKRYPVSEGDHPEKELVADDLRLKGRVDLLSIDPDGVRITDFKTGAEDLAHHDQLRLYALLWADDALVNPEGLPATSLVASYPSHEIAVPVPDENELAGLRSDIAARIEVADAAVMTDPPDAVVGDYCGLCDVRGLCDTYWMTSVPRTADVADGSWYDLHGTVVREHGVKSWVLREAHTGREVLVRTPTPSDALPLDHDVRILGARRVVDPDEEDALIAALTSVSEVLQLTE
jgi:hypothetical protein